MAKGIPLMGRDPDGKAKMINVDENGNVKVQLSGTIAKAVTLANAVAITDTSVRDYNLITHGEMTADEIRQYREFKISVSNTLDQPVTIGIGTAVLAFHPLALTSSGQLYTENNIVPANGKMVFTASAGGTGASQIKVVPALKGVHSNLIVRTVCATAPTTGSLTVAVEMN